MERREKRPFSARPLIDFVRNRLNRATIVSAGVDGSKLTDEEQRELYLSTIPGTAAHARAAQKLVDSFDQVELHRKRRRKGGIS